MDNNIRWFKAGIVARLDELQSGSEFESLLKSSEPDLREEALRLHEEINQLKASIESI